MLQVRRDGGNQTPLPPSLQTAPLHYGNHEPLTLEENKDQYLNMDIIRIPSDIRVVMRGLERQETSLAHTFTIEDNNRTTRFVDASIAPDDSITYLPRYTDLWKQVDSSLTSYFTVMRLGHGRHPLLKLYAGDTLQRQWDLLDEILGKYPEANFETGNDYEIIFTFEEGYLAVSITINGWEIIDEGIEE